MAKEPQAFYPVAVAGVAAALVAVGLAVSLSRLWYEPRPFVTDAGTVRLISHAADASFPSDHAALAAAVATVGALAWKSARIPLAALAGFIGLGRVFVGVHYPGDVLAGAALGVAVGMAAWWMTDRVTGPVESPRSRNLPTSAAGGS